MRKRYKYFRVYCSNCKEYIVLDLDKYRYPICCKCNKDLRGITGTLQDKLK